MPILLTYRYWFLFLGLQLISFFNAPHIQEGQVKIELEMNGTGIPHIRFRVATGFIYVPQLGDT